MRMSTQQRNGNAVKKLMQRQNENIAQNIEDYPERNQSKNQGRAMLAGTPDIGSQIEDNKEDTAHNQQLHAKPGQRQKLLGLQQSHFIDLTQASTIHRSLQNGPASWMEAINHGQGHLFSPLASWFFCLLRTTFANVSNGASFPGREGWRRNAILSVLDCWRLVPRRESDETYRILE